MKFDGNTNTGHLAVILHYGGADRRFICPVCGMIEDSGSLIVKHIRAKHEVIKDLVFKCSDCEFNSQKVSSVGHHKRYCRGPVQRKGHPCEHCVFSSDSANGLKVHMATIHPEQWNTHLPLKRKNFRWDEAGLRFVAKKYLEFRKAGVRGIDNEIAGLLPDRSKDAIRKIRSKAEFKAILREEELLDQSNEAQQPETQPEEEQVQANAGLRAAAREALNNIERTGTRNADLDSAVDAYITGRCSWEELSVKVVAQGAPTPRVKPPEKKRRRRVQRNNAKGRARAKYKQLQRAWSKDRKATIQQIVDGNFRYDDDQSVLPAVDQVEEVYSERLESPKSIKQVKPAPAPILGGDVYGAFRVEEVAQAIKSTKSDTARGIDGMSIEAVKSLGSENVTAIMNLWWADGIPDAAKTCRTTLIPKEGERRDDVNGWRPITIGTLLARLYAKVWDRRLRKLVKLDVRQQGFVPVDGCYNNVKLLQHAIKQRRKSRKEINVVFLDLAKAFDTVSHDSIFNALRRHRVPEEVIDGIREMYESASTVIRVGEETTRPIKILRGVKQGCPLSPLLFNIVMDELLLRFDQRNDLGIQVGNEKVSIMAFADDLVIITESGEQCCLALDICSEFFGQNGLKVNAKKCASLRVLPTKGRAMKVVVEPHRYWNGVPIPSVHWDNLYKYLGVRILPNGCINVSEGKFKDMFQRIKGSKLKATQKLECITSVVLPRMLFELRLADTPIGILKRLNTLVRREVKELLRLPPWCPTDWIHSNGGLGIMDLAATTLRAQRKAVVRLGSATEGAQTCAEVVATELSPSIDCKLRRINLLEGHRLVTKDELERRRRERILELKNGKCIKTMMDSDANRRSWLVKHGKLKDRLKLTIMKGLSGTLPHRVNQTRGRRIPAEKLCRRCNKTAETDLHILAECQHTKGLRSTRHDRVVDALGSLIRKRNEGWKTEVERSWCVGMRVFRPDITVYAGSKVYLCEVTIPFEKDHEYMVQREREKALKYETLRKTLDQSGRYESVEVVPIVIGAWGTIQISCRQALTKLNVKSGIGLLTSIAAIGSSVIARTHLNTNEF